MKVLIEVPDGTNSIKVISCEKVVNGQQMTIKNTKTQQFEGKEVEKLEVKYED